MALNPELRHEYFNGAMNPLFMAQHQNHVNKAAVNKYWDDIISRSQGSNNNIIILAYPIVWRNLNFLTQ